MSRVIISVVWRC